MNCVSAVLMAGNPVIEMDNAHKYVFIPVNAKLTQVKLVLDATCTGTRRQVYHPGRETCDRAEC